MSIVKKVFLILALACSLATAQDLPLKFINAVHQVETGGRKGAILGDGGAALGPFQIHYAYWLDSGIQGDYKQCADYNYSIRVINSYLRKYGYQAIKKKDFKTLARLHNAGPQALKNKKISLDYWAKVSKHI